MKQEYLVLEIGCGTGIHTEVLINSNAQIIGTDISEKSIEFLEAKFGKANNLKLKVADMENLPFSDNYFNIVVSAGCLSYGDNNKVMNEIRRVLKSGGLFICVDSMNHNPIYKINRWVHYLRGERTLSTLKRMPRIELIKNYRKTFGAVDIHYFGGISWLISLLSSVVKNDELLKKISDRFDIFFNVKKSAFKFVMVARKTKE